MRSSTTAATQVDESTVLTTRPRRLHSRDGVAGHSGAVIALVTVALVWGGAFSLVKETLATVTPASLVTWRFTVATCVLLLARPRSLLGLSRRVVARGVVLGALLGAGFLLHTSGMERTSVVISAFITGTVVVFAPLVARIWLHRRLGLRSGAAIGLATLGLGAITLHGASFGSGELLIAAAAVLWAVHLVALEAWARPGEVYQSALVQMAVVATLAAAVEAASVGHTELPTRITTLLALLLLGAVATAGAFLLLTWAQTRTDSTTSAVVLTLEPVFGGATALALGEALTWPVGLGAAAIVTATFVIVRSTEGSTSRPLARRRLTGSPRRRGRRVVGPSVRRRR